MGAAEHPNFRRSRYHSLVMGFNTTQIGKLKGEMVCLMTNSFNLKLWAAVLQSSVTDNIGEYLLS